MSIPVRKIINKVLTAAKVGKHVAVLLSAGMDSASVCLSLMDLGIRPVCYSFALEGGSSTDFDEARNRARLLGLTFSPIRLPITAKAIIAGMRGTAQLGARTKTDYECGYPVVYAMYQITEPVIVTGHGADGHFCISKKGMIHYRNNIDTFRRGLFSNPRYCQKPLLDKAAAAEGKRFVMPYLASEMVNAFMGSTWDEVNRPKQKQPIIDAYPELTEQPIKIRPHINLQLGDSHIAERYAEVLLASGIAPGAKSPVKVYNVLTKEVHNGIT